MRQGRQYSKSQLLQSIKNYYVQQQHMLAAASAAGMEFKVVNGKLTLQPTATEVAAPCVE